MADDNATNDQATKADEPKDEATTAPAEETNDEAKASADEKKEAPADKPAEPKEEAEKDSKESAPAKEYSADITKIVGQVEKMSVLEVADLVSAIEDKFGVSAAPVAVASAPAASGTGGGDDAAAEEKSSYTVHLTASGGQKINVIKAVREVTQLGLKEAKDLVDGAPKDVKTNVPKEEADEAKQKLEAAGATVELK